MAAYLRARASAALATLFGLSLLLFLLTRIVPGGPCAAYNAPYHELLSAQQRAACVSRFGVGQPLPLQYLITIGGYLRGDLDGTPAAPGWYVITSAFPETLLLLGSTLIVSLTAALLFGLWAARRVGSGLDRLFLTFTDNYS